jgi:hypothetical protein
MTLNEKVINHKVLDLLILYNFDIKFKFIRDHMKIVINILCGTICRGGSCHHALLKNIFSGACDATTASINTTISRDG